MQIDLFDSVVPSDGRVTRRPMFGCPAAFVGGKLFACLHKQGIILKLADEDRQRLQADHGARPFEPLPGRRMGEFIVLPQGAMADRSTLQGWLSRALAYVSARTVGNESPAAPSPGKRARRRASTA